MSQWLSFCDIVRLLQQNSLMCIMFVFIDKIDFSINSLFSNNLINLSDSVKIMLHQFLLVVLVVVI